jgi:cytochrome P450
MEYMDGFINEGLRMYGPGAMNFIREVKSENFTIGNGVNVPPKTYISCINMIHHFNQKHFKSPQ